MLNLDLGQSFEIAGGMRCDSADFIGGRSAASAAISPDIELQSILSMLEHADLVQTGGSNIAPDGCYDVRTRYCKAGVRAVWVDTQTGEMANRQFGRDDLITFLACLIVRREGDVHSISAEPVR